MEIALTALIWALFVAVLVLALFGAVYISARTDKITQESLYTQEQTRHLQRELPR